MRPIRKKPPTARLVASDDRIPVTPPETDGGNQTDQDEDGGNDPLRGHTVTPIAQRVELRQTSFPIATAVSAMRLEKPHSLSYQDITRTNVPSITLVWSMWKTDECGSWLKSIETLGASV